MDNYKYQSKNPRYRSKTWVSDIIKSVKAGWSVYCENSSLQGFRYIAMKELTIKENIFWFVICASSFTFCLVLCSRIWVNYAKNPIMTSIYTSNPIWDFSFPGVTICNNNKVYRPHADIIEKHLYTNGFSTSDSEQFFSSLLKLIRPDKITINNITATQVLDILGMTVETLMSELMQPCNALLVRCAWLGQIYNCNKIFKTIKSKEGFCCAFNSHFNETVQYESNNEYDSSTSHYNFTDFNITSEEELPGVKKILRVPGTGRDVGLAVALNVEADNYKASVRPYIGATVLIHDAIDFPDIGAQLASVTPGHVLGLTLSGTSIRNMESTRNLDLQQRQCYFETEKADEKVYSFQTCMSRCRAKQIQTNCGCLPFYYPEIYTEVRTCYLTDISCLLSLRKIVSEADTQKTEECKTCLPQCMDKIYNIQVENVPMDDIGYDSEITRGLDVRTTSFVYIYFGDVTYIEYRKENILTWDQFMANFGGIFGLCLGGSLISIVEAFYIGIKQCYKSRQRQRQPYKGLPPASEMFSPIPIEKAQMQKRNDQKIINERVFFVSSSSVPKRRKSISKFNNVPIKSQIHLNQLNYYN